MFRSGGGGATVGRFTPPADPFMGGLVGELVIAGVPLGRCPLAVYTLSGISESNNIRNTEEAV